MIIPKEIFIKKNSLLFYSSFIILLLAAAFRDGSLFHDYANYENAVNNFTFTWGYLLGKEVSFVLIAAISNLFSSPSTFFFFIYAFLSLLVKYYALNIGSEKFYFSLFAFFCIFYIPHELTQIRVSVAAGFFMLGYIYIVKGRSKLFYFSCFVAFLFHFSAIILFPLYLILRCKYRNNYLFFVLPFLGLFLHYFNFLKLFIDLLIQYTPQMVSNKLAIYNEFVLNGEMDKIVLFNANFLVFLCIYILFCLPQFYKKMSANVDQELVITWRLLSIGIFCYFSFSYIAVFSFRTFELLIVPLVISLPCLMRYYKQKGIIELLLIFLLLLYFAINFLTLIHF